MNLRIRIERSMASRDEDVRKFKRASEQRLKAAGLLFKHEFFLEATYIAGYAIECSLKELILKRTPRNQYERMLDKLIRVGAKGHDFEYLRRIFTSAPVNCVMPDEIHEIWRRVSTWSTQLRYEVAIVRLPEATRFLEATKRIREWVERS